MACSEAAEEYPTTIGHPQGYYCVREPVSALPSALIFAWSEKLLPEGSPVYERYIGAMGQSWGASRPPPWYQMFHEVSDARCAMGHGACVLASADM